MAESSPDKLFMELQNGSQNALGHLYRQVGPSLLRYLRSIQCHQPEDVLQETFLALFKQSAKLRTDTTIQAWLFKVARNQAFKGYSRLKMVPIEDSNTPKHTPNPDQTIAVQTAFQTLEEPFRSTLALFHWEGFSLEEISSIMEIPINTVKTRLYRARQLLKKKLASNGVKPKGQNDSSGPDLAQDIQPKGLNSLKTTWVFRRSSIHHIIRNAFQYVISSSETKALKHFWNKRNSEGPKENPLRWCPS